MSARTVGTVAVGVACALLLSGCAALYDLRGPYDGDWRLVEAVDADGPLPMDGSGAWLSIDRRFASVFSGCAVYGLVSFGGTKDVDLDRQAPTTDPEKSDADFFDAPPECDAVQEDVHTRFMDALLSTGGAAVDGDVLRLAGDGATLTFERQPGFPIEELADTVWTLERYGDTWNGEAPALLGQPMLRFHGQDRFTATLGCGSVEVEYQPYGSQAALLSYDRTGVLGCGAESGEQDRTLERALNGFSAVLDGDRLTLIRQRTALVYRAADSG